MNGSVHQRRITFVSEFYPPFIYGGAEVSTDLLVKKLSESYICDVVTSKLSKTSWHRHGCLVRPLLRRQDLGTKSTPALMRYAIDAVTLPIRNAIVLNRHVRTRKDDVIDFVYSSYTQAPLILITKLLQSGRIVIDVRDFSLICVSNLSYEGYQETNEGHSCFHHLKRMYAHTGRLIRPLLPAFGAYEVLLFQTYTSTLRFLVNHADIRMVAISQYVKEKLVQNGFRACRIDVVPNMVQELSGKPFAHNSIIYDLAYAGRIETSKGIWDIIHACEQLTLETPILAIAGDGTQFDEVQVYISNNRLDNIALLGKVSPDEVVQLYSKSKFIVAPSRGPEGFGRFIQESTLTGTPVIAPRFGGIPEGIVDGVNGFLYDSGDVNSLTRAITKALGASEASMRSMREAVLKTREMYSSETILAARRRSYDGKTEF